MALALGGCGGSSGALPGSDASGLQDAATLVDASSSEDTGSGDATGPAEDAATSSDGSTPSDASGVDSSSDDGGPGVIIVVGPPGSPGQDIVTGGVVATSASYTLYATMGESPGGNGVMSSANYTMIGGLLGTTQQ